MRLKALLTLCLTLACTVSEKCWATEPLTGRENTSELFERIAAEGSASMTVANGRSHITTALDLLAKIRKARKFSWLEPKGETALLDIALGKIQFRYFSQNGSAHFSNEFEPAANEFILKKTSFLSSYFFSILRNAALEPSTAPKALTLIKNIALHLPLERLKADVTFLETELSLQRKKNQETNQLLTELATLVARPNHLDYGIQKLIELAHVSQFFTYDQAFADLAESKLRDVRQKTNSLGSTFNHPQTEVHLLKLALSEANLGRTLHGPDLNSEAQRFATELLLTNLPSLSERFFKELVKAAQTSKVDKTRMVELVSQLAQHKESSLHLARSTHELIRHFEHYEHIAGHEARGWLEKLRGLKMRAPNSCRKIIEQGA